MTTTPWGAAVRPRGEIRAAMAQAFDDLVHERGLVVDGVAVDGVTWREAAAAASVGFELARRTTGNMLQAGELVRLGRVKPAGSQHWSGVYAPSAVVPAKEVIAPPTFAPMAHL